MPRSSFPWPGRLTIVEQKVFDPKPVMSATGNRLPHARLNYCENVLLSHPSARSKTKLALITATEPPKSAESQGPLTLGTFTFEQLYDSVRLVSQSLRECGIGPGDNVAAYSPTNAEAVICMLATSAVGGVWSCVAAEAGPKAALERFQQVRWRLRS
jgi:acetoacetyl-CoA synthetase